VSSHADHNAFTVRQLTGLTEVQLHELAHLLIDCVEGGASVSFMHPLPLPKALTFWHGIADEIAAGTRMLFVAEIAAGIAGTVQVSDAYAENQPHRADISKLLVHRRARRRGLGAALMRAAEAGARRAGKSLLVLDTASGDAERLYAREGWTLAGIIPDFALWPKGGLCSTSIYYRKLA
jgi:GNAT superfamily N-acetyltransferase